MAAFGKRRGQQSEPWQEELHLLDVLVGDGQRGAVGMQREKQGALVAALSGVARHMCYVRAQGRGRAISKALTASCGNTNRSHRALGRATLSAACHKR